MQPSSSDMMKRLALAAIGQVLPETSVLSRTVSDLRKGLLATVMCGVLIAGLLLLGCFGFYHFLITEGLTPFTAIMLSSGLLALLALISALYANKYLTRVEQVKETLSPFSAQKIPPLSSQVDVLIAEFLDGFNTDVRDK